MDDKVAFYRRGIDELEDIDPFVAYLVSKHYTTFSGTRDVARLTEPEELRRERLRQHLDDNLVGHLEKSLEWVKFFDILSLYICLAGPGAARDSIPGWLSGDHWHEARMERHWMFIGWMTPGYRSNRGHLCQAALCWHSDKADGRFADRARFDEAWNTASPETRQVNLVDATNVAR